jgi:hypothetical protein
MDRIEAALDRREAAQERHRQNLSRDYEQLMNWQVLMQDKMDRFSEDRDRERQRLDQLWENTDKRIADLVAAIGKLIER